MTEKEDGNGKSLVPADDRGQYEMFREMAAIERERIESRNRMTDAMTAGVAHLNEADKRQFDFRKDKMERDDNYRNRRLSHIVRFGWALFGLGALVVGVFGFMILWGSPEQRAAAFTGVGFVGAYGAGFLSGRFSRGR